jgi:futalosine hydrolase
VNASHALLLVVATDAERPHVPGYEVLVSGVGKTGAATATARRLAAGGVRGVISFGVAGAYPGEGLGIGDVVLASEVGVIDEGLDNGERFTAFARAGMPVPGAGWTHCDASLVAAAPTDATHRVVRGRIATVSVCAGSARLATERAATGAVAESMEGAAVAYVATTFGLPFAEVRGISNLCGPREGAPFDIVTAVRNAARHLA